MPPPDGPDPLVIPLPTFRQPQQPPRDPALPEDENQPQPHLQAVPSPEGRASSPTPATDGASPSDPTRPSPDGGRRSIRTFSRGEAETAGKLLGGLVLIVAGLVGWSLRQRGRDLRKPDQGELDAVCQPIGRILCRHVDAGLLTPDLADGVEAAAGVSDYVLSRPISRGLYVENAGIPTHDLED